MTGAFSRNVGKLFSELKLVTDNLLFICAAAHWEATENIYVSPYMDISLQHPQNGCSTWHCLYHIPGCIHSPVGKIHLHYIEDN